MQKHSPPGKRPNDTLTGWSNFTETRRRLQLLRTPVGHDSRERSVRYRDGAQPRQRHGEPSREFFVRFSNRTMLTAQTPITGRYPGIKFILIPRKDGSSPQDYIRTLADLQAALEIKSLVDSVPHHSADGRELTAEFFRDKASSIISNTDVESAFRVYRLIRHLPSKQGRQTRRGHGQSFKVSAERRAQ